MTEFDECLNLLSFLLNTDKELYKINENMLYSILKSNVNNNPDILYLSVMICITFINDLDYLKYCLYKCVIDKLLANNINNINNYTNCNINSNINSNIKWSNSFIDDIDNIKIYNE